MSPGRYWNRCANRRGTIPKAVLGRENADTQPWTKESLAGQPQMTALISTRDNICCSGGMQNENMKCRTGAWKTFPEDSEKANSSNRFKLREVVPSSHAYDSCHGENGDHGSCPHPLSLAAAVHILLPQGCRQDEGQIVPPRSQNVSENITIRDRRCALLKQRGAERLSSVYPADFQATVPAAPARRSVHRT